MIQKPIKWQQMKTIEQSKQTVLYLFVLFQKVVRLPEGTFTQRFFTSLTQTFDAIGQFTRGRRHVLQPTIRRAGHGRDRWTQSGQGSIRIVVIVATIVVIIKVGLNTERRFLTTIVVIIIVIVVVPSTIIIRPFFKIILKNNKIKK